MRSRPARLIRWIAAMLMAAALPCAWGFDANGVQLGSRETDVRKSFPGARCKPLEWRTDAADRRCDDAEVLVGGVQSRITFYLKKDSVKGFDLRFDVVDMDRMVSFLKSRFGVPSAEAKDAIQRKGGNPREVYTVRWDKAGDHALLTAQMEKKRASLTVSRGDFDEAIYRVQ